MASAPYKLSCVLYGHNLDVRCIAVTREGYIVSGSRDKSAKIWKPDGIMGYSEVMELHGHTGFVASLCVLPPNSEHPQGLIITGSNDSKIRIFSPDCSQALTVLTGHTDTVCNLYPGLGKGVVLSASWDNTARVWQINFSRSLVLTLSGHEGTVWSVIQLASGNIVTGSADKTLKVWLCNGVFRRTLKGHTDCVRDLTPTSVNEFLSCSNDATVRHWNAQTGDCLGCFYGHSNYIYSISVFPRGGADSFVTSGEDHTVRIWNFGEVAQTINLPALSVWSNACLPNGDIAVGSSDGIVRVFSCDANRQADQELLQKSEEQVANAEVSPQTEFLNLRISELPDTEALNQPAQTDGQHKLVKERNFVTYYSWSAGGKKWVKVGDMFRVYGNSAATPGKQIYEGKEYDYIFSVDVGEGKPPLKLPYNCKEDPWQTALRFITENDLNPLYCEQVANFIIKQTKGAGPWNSTALNTSSYCDPLTGGSRYIPGIASDIGDASANADPFTGNSRYVPSTGNAWSGGFTGGFEPCTCDSHHETATTQTESLPGNRYFPLKQYVQFDIGNPLVILEKLLQFNCKIGDSSHVIEKDLLEEVVNLGELGASANPQCLELLKQLLEWPEDMLFPVLDVIRLAVRNKEINSRLCSGQSGDELMETLQQFLIADSPVANQFLLLRIYCNMFTHTAGETLALKNQDYLLSAIEEMMKSSNKQVQIAITTLLMNLAVAFSRMENYPAQIRGVSLTMKVLPCLTVPEAQFRCLVALGTFIWEAGDQNLIKLVVSSSELKTVLKELAKSEGSSSTEPQQATTKLIECAEIIIAELHL